MTHMDNRLLIIFLNEEVDTLTAIQKDLATDIIFLHSELIKLPSDYKNPLQNAQCDKAIYLSTGEKKLGEDNSWLRYGNSLNYQMYNAFLQAFSKGYSSVCMIYGFNPDLPPDIIDRAFTRLRDFEVVLGPTLDGGCYLLGMNQMQQMLFSSSEWTDNMFIKEIIKEIQPAQLKTSLLPIMKDDPTLGCAPKGVNGLDGSNAPSSF